MGCRKTYSRGFSLVEVLVGVSVFLILVIAVYNSYHSVFGVVYAGRAKIDAIDLANEQLEIIRNMPYAEVGIAGGIPNGVLSHTQMLVRGSNQFTVTTTVRNVDDPFDGTLGGTPNDTSPADHKLVEVDVDCAACHNFATLSVTTMVSPKGLETASTNGALIIKVFDADGVPVPGAAVHIENNQISPHIVIDDVTDNNGMLAVVDAPPGTNAYEITVTKSGYSTDKTYAATVSNPHPSKPHATVLLQQVTQLSFAIDELSSITFQSDTPACVAVPSVHFELAGNKIIGTPNVLKYDQTKVTDGSGQLTVPSLEWDSYSITNTDAAYDIIGYNPLSPINLSPGSSQNVILTVVPKNPATLLVTVRDSATSLPLSGVAVTLAKTGMASSTTFTGQGYMSQTDWSGGPGQATSTNLTQYFSSDGNIEISSPAGDLYLKKIFSNFVASGSLISSSFDVGGAVNFGSLLWLPVGQPAAVGTPNVRFQIATNNDGGTWNFTGPDGTASTYYTTGNQNISPANNGNRYLRYRVLLDTATTTASPNISDVSFTYTSACTPPGQVWWNGLGAGTYTLHLSKAGYADQDLTVSVGSNWTSQDVSMTSN